VQLVIDVQQHQMGKPLWVLFDEVQYLKDWEVHLTSLVDTYPAYGTSQAARPPPCA
jgi:predicted AAA+ superfamily ATPase